MIRWIALLSLVISCGPAKNLPEFKSTVVKLLDSTHEKNFNLLPKTGSTQKIFWSDSSWSRERSLINWRWNSSESETGDYPSPYQIEVFLMTQDQLATLSPAEKFDLFIGRYDYPLKEEAFGNLEKSFDPTYSWQVASLFHQEPKIKLMTNPDGILIPFGSSDIKALLSYHYSIQSPPIMGDAIGKLCHDKGCEGDLDAGTFHVTLGNKLGTKAEAFFMDLHPKDEVEPRLAIKYNSNILDESLPDHDDPAGTTKVLKVITRMTFLETLDAPSWEPSGPSYTVKEFNYYLYLNLKNEIIGGQWLNNERPDSLWVVKREDGFTGLLEGLEKILIE